MHTTIYYIPMYKYIFKKTKSFQNHMPAFICQQNDEGKNVRKMRRPASDHQLVLKHKGGLCAKHNANITAFCRCIDTYICYCIYV